MGARSFRGCRHSQVPRLTFRGEGVEESPDLDVSIMYGHFEQKQNDDNDCISFFLLLHV